MARSTSEWIGKDDDSPIPPKVKLRVKSRANDCCQACGARVRYGAQIDHVVALINGGENRESNLRLLCKTCHARKTRSDIAEKSAAARTQAHLASFRRPKRPFWKPPKPEKPVAVRNWYFDDRGRLCSSFLKPDKEQKP